MAGTWRGWAMICSAGRGATAFGAITVCAIVFGGGVEFQSAGFDATLFDHSAKAGLATIFTVDCFCVGCTTGATGRDGLARPENESPVGLLVGDRDRLGSEPKRWLNDACDMVGAEDGEDGRGAAIGRYAEICVVSGDADCGLNNPPSQSIAGAAADAIRVCTDFGWAGLACGTFGLYCWVADANCGVVGPNDGMGAGFDPDGARGPGRTVGTGTCDPGNGIGLAAAPVIASCTAPRAQIGNEPMKAGLPAMLAATCLASAGCSCANC